MGKVFTVGDTRLLFEEDKHLFRRWVGDTMVVVPSVTKFTGIIDKSTPLLKWSAKLAKEFLLPKVNESLFPITVEDIMEAVSLYEVEREAAAATGVAVHAAIEQWVANHEPPDTSDDAIQNCFRAFCDFEAKYQPNWRFVETMHYSESYDFAGISDLIGDIGGVSVLADIKSGSQIYPEYAFQTAGYQIAFEEMTGETIDYRMIIRLDKKSGKFEVKECRNNRDDRKAFLACQFLHKRLSAVQREWKNNNVTI